MEPVPGANKTDSSTQTDRPMMVMIPSIRLNHILDWALLTDGYVTSVFQFLHFIRDSVRSFSEVPTNGSETEQYRLPPKNEITRGEVIVDHSTTVSDYFNHVYYNLDTDTDDDDEDDGGRCGGCCITRLFRR